MIISSARAEESSHEGAVAGTAAHHEGSAFPPFDAANFAPQVVWLILVFGVLYALMSWIALPRVAGILANRRKTIDADLDASRELQTKAQAAAAHNDATLKAKKEEAQAIGRDSQQRIAAEVAAARTSAESKFAQEIAAAEARIAAEKTRAMSHVEGIATEAAGAIIAKLTGKQVDAGTLGVAFKKIAQ